MFPWTYIISYIPYLFDSCHLYQFFQNCRMFYHSSSWVPMQILINFEHLVFPLEPDQFHCEYHHTSRQISWRSCCRKISDWIQDTFNQHSIKAEIYTSQNVCWKILYCTCTISEKEHRYQESYIETHNLWWHVNTLFLFMSL